MRALEILDGFWKAPTIAAAAMLGLGDALGVETQETDALAARLGVDPTNLMRLLRALASLGLVEQLRGNAFRLTKDGQALRSDTPGSIVGRARHVGTALLPAFVQLDRSVTSGAPPSDIKFGPDGFAELNQDPANAHIFNQSMLDNSRRVAARAADSYDFSRFDHVMDVGGGYGGMLAVMLQRYPKMRGSILDLPHAKDGAERYLADQGLAERARFIEGSFFDPIPPEAACYLLKWIIHDWSDHYAEQIMVRVGEAARAGSATVVLIERIVPDALRPVPEHGAIAAADLTMMLWGGRERTEAEFRALFESAGLMLTQSVPIGTGLYTIEGVPA